MRVLTADHIIPRRFPPPRVVHTNLFIETLMRAFAIAWILVTLPAIVVIIFLIGNPTWIVPAVASLLVNSLPFLVAGLLVSNQRPRGHRSEAH